MKRNLTIVTGVALALALAIFWGCAKKESEKVIAVVGEKSITEQDLTDRISLVTKGFSSTKLSAEAIRGILNDLVERQLILGYAESLGITADDAEIDEYLQKLSLVDTQEYPRETARQDLIIAKIVEQEVASKIDNAELDSVTVTPPETPGGVLYTFLEITVTSQEQAQQLLDQLRSNNPPDFSMLARENSISVSRFAGGSQGPVSEADLPAKFVETLQKLQPDQISDVVESEYGFHIFKLVSRSAPDTESSNKTLDVEKFRIAYKADYEKWLNALKDKIYIKLDENRLDEFINNYQAP
jgi:hypothetical protein